MAPTPSTGCSSNNDSVGKIEASVLPPAVGASTTAFFPSSRAASASSCTGSRLDQPRRETMASCSLGAKRAKTLIAVSPRIYLWDELVILHVRRGERGPRQRMLLLGSKGGRPWHLEAILLHRVVVRVLLHEIHLRDELA